MDNPLHINILTTQRNPVTLLCISWWVKYKMLSTIKKWQLDAFLGIEVAFDNTTTQPIPVTYTLFLFATYILFEKYEYAMQVPYN